MDAKHTPKIDMSAPNQGPVGELTGLVQVWLSPDGKNIKLVTTGTARGRDAEIYSEVAARFNAHGDLVAACEAALTEIGAWHDNIADLDPMKSPEANVWQQLRAALAKARGE